MAKKIINVKSESQKGGTTAGIVNIFKNDDLKENKGVWAKPYFKYLLIPVMVILIGTGIIWGVTKIFNKEENKDKKVYNVTSRNQQGGITAGEVNIGKTPRIFNQQVALALQAHLPSEKDKTIVITAVMGDQEAFQFAEQIKEYLSSQGWKVDGVDQAVYSKPVVGQIIKPRSDGKVEIIIGGKE